MLCAACCLTDCCICFGGDTVSGSEYMRWNDRMIGGKWAGKDVEGSGCGLICDVARLFGWTH
jgi:hypothetical protein